MPKDPYMLLSFVNTQLRDNYKSLDDLASSYGVDAAQVTGALSAIGYSYDEEKNSFITSV